MADFAFTRQDETSVASATTKTVPLTCHGHSRPITHLSFSSLLPPQNPSQPTLSNAATPQYHLISSSKDSHPILRQGSTGDWIGTLISHKGAVWSCRLSSDSSLAATGSADFSAKVWDTFTGECLVTLPHGHIVRAVAFPPGNEDGVGGGGERPMWLATGGMEKKLLIFDLSRIVDGEAVEGKDIPFYEIGAGVHLGAIKSIVWSRDPNILTTASDDKVLRWWDLRTREMIASYTLDALPSSCELNSGLSPSDPLDAVLSVAAGKNVYFFDGAQPGKLLKGIKMPRDVASVAFNGEARKFVTGSPSDTWVRVWDFDSELEVETGRGHHGPVWTTAFSPDGKLYATGSEDGTVKLWKFTQGAYGLWR
ncbi:hypothetical protein LTR42_005557 [Elasticomyces elasticus]|nr:hypothetical protein LTR42_005557 [Elasticomyces elasticus]